MPTFPQKRKMCGLVYSEAMVTICYMNAHRIYTDTDKNFDGFKIAGLMI